MPRHLSKEAACLMHKALGFDNDRKRAIRFMLDGAMALIINSDDPVREWASTTMFNLACDASPHDCSEIADEPHAVN